VRTGSRGDVGGVDGKKGVDGARVIGQMKGGGGGWGVGWEGHSGEIEGGRKGREERSGEKEGEREPEGVR